MMKPLSSFLLATISCASVAAAKPFLNTNRAVTNPIYNLGASAGIVGKNASYDYVVVGGGTAGLTIAATLVSDPSITVAVVEAGGSYEVEAGNLSVIPAQCTYYTGTSPADTNPEIDWGFVTEPQAVNTVLSGFFSRADTIRRALTIVACTMLKAELSVVLPLETTWCITGTYQPAEAWRATRTDHELGPP